MSMERSRDDLLTSGKAVVSAYVKKDEVRVKFFDFNCVEMGAEAIEMD